MIIKLAIVIPYFKISYFEELLRALAGQTNKNFNLYVCDDCSTENPESILQKYSGHLDFKYFRHPERRGHISLASQWNRCLQVLGEEEWVWFLPDDDLPSPNCVAGFYNLFATEETRDIKVIRFPLNIVNRTGGILSYGQASPPVESNYDFYLRLLKGQTECSLGDNIFHRDSLVRCGGFVEFPKAWGSDHATVLQVASGGLIRFLKDSSVAFRMGGDNISSDTSDSSEKMRARILFARWLRNHEDIFPVKPEHEFYQYFYWKGEHYATHQWWFSVTTLLNLYVLRTVCFRSLNPLPVIKLVLLKISGRLDQG